MIRELKCENGHVLPSIFKVTNKQGMTVYITNCINPDTEQN